MRKLVAALSLLALLSGLGSSVAAACCTEIIHPCCVRQSPAQAGQSLERPACCTSRELRTPPAAPATRFKRLPAWALVATPALRVSRKVEQRGDLVDTPPRLPGLARALEPPLRLRI